MQQVNGMEFVFKKCKDRLPVVAPQLHKLSDGGWDQSPRVPETQFALALDHLDHDRDFSWSGTRPTGQQVFNESERLNGA